MQPPEHPDFEWKRRLGRGGNAEVWEALYKPLGKEVAVGNAEHEMIKAECRLLQQLDSKYVIKYYASLTKTNELITELCSAGSARDVIMKCGNFPELQAVVLLKQLLKSLEYLHSRSPPIVHRDIKAGNVLLHETGRVKIGDFGIATHDTGQLNTEIGSPYWLAPEMLPSPTAVSTAAPTNYDQRVDIWALGITAIELVQGKPPLMHVPALKAVFLLATSTTVPTLDKPQSFSSAYNSFIADCLQRDPNKRPSAATLRKHPLFAGACDRSLLQAYLENRYRFKKSPVTEEKVSPRARLAGARPRAAVAALSDDESSDDEPPVPSYPLRSAAPNAAGKKESGLWSSTGAIAAGHIYAYPFLSTTAMHPQQCRPAVEQLPYNELVKSKKQRQHEAKEKEKEKEREKEREKNKRVRQLVTDVPPPRRPLLDLVPFDITTCVPLALLTAATAPAAKSADRLAVARIANLLDQNPTVASTSIAVPKPGPSPPRQARTNAVVAEPAVGVLRSAQADVGPVRRNRGVDLPLPIALAQPQAVTGSLGPMLAATRSISPHPSHSPRDPSLYSSGGISLLPVPAPAPTNLYTATPPSLISPPSSTSSSASSSPSATSAFVTAQPSAGRGRRAELTNSSPSSSPASSSAQSSPTSSPSPSVIAPPPAPQPSPSPRSPRATPLAAQSVASFSSSSYTSLPAPPRWPDWPSFFAETGLPEHDCHKYATMFKEQLVELNQIPYLDETVLKRLMPAQHIQPIIRLAQKHALPK